MQSRLWQDSQEDGRLPGPRAPSCGLSWCGEVPGPASGWPRAAAESAATAAVPEHSYAVHRSTAMESAAALRRLQDTAGRCFEPCNVSRFARTPVERKVPDRGLPTHPQAPSADSAGLLARRVLEDLRARRRRVVARAHPRAPDHRGSHTRWRSPAPAGDQLAEITGLQHPPACP